jgi:uncharacterized repeat protein (TIGR03803 family)
MRRSKILGILLALVFSLTAVAQGQTYADLHSFTGGRDGAHPLTGLTMDRAGNLYGTTSVGGYLGGACGNVGGCGTVFRLSPKNGSWIFTMLYEFQGGQDGESPQAALTIGPDGAIYGTTLYGGAFGCSVGYGCGIAFKLTPGTSICRTALCSWHETIIYDFAEDPHGISTPYGGLIFDQEGNIYGAAFAGGVGVCARACGAVYQLTPSQGGWSLTPIYVFTGGDDGASPMSTLLRDSHGNLYGTSSYGGINQGGTVFELVPSGQTWTFNLLYSFRGQEDGSNPMVGLVMDSAGNLYGNTAIGAVNFGGAVFQLSPQGSGWSFTVLDSPAGGLYAPLNIDSHGNLYGTTYAGGASGLGLVFELTHSGNGWIEHDLYSFSGADGALAYSNVTLDNSGRLYGTTSSGGGDQAGVVWELTP